MQRTSIMIFWFYLSDIRENLTNLEDILKDFKNKPPLMFSVRSSNVGSQTADLPRQKKANSERMVGYTLLQFRIFVKEIVLILKVPLDGNLMVWYNSLRDAYIYGRCGNSSVNAINASAVSLSGTRCPSIPNSVPKTKFPVDLKTAIQSKVFLLLRNKLRSICWFLHSWFRFHNFSLDGMASGRQINDSRE